MELAFGSLRCVLSLQSFDIKDDGQRLPRLRGLHRVPARFLRHSKSHRSHQLRASAAASAQAIKKHGRTRKYRHAPEWRPDRSGR